ncbi:MAG: DUF3631 domain-containing protein [Acidobacteriota bacterium]
MLFRSEDLLNARSNEGVVLVVEGEKDAERAKSLGLVAVCNPEGAGSWRDEYSQQLRDLPVLVVADRDEPGRRHAEAVAISLFTIAGSVRLGELPGNGINDLSDWIEEGTCRGFESASLRAQLLEWADSVPEFTGGSEPHESGKASSESRVEALFQSIAGLADDADLEPHLRELGKIAPSLDPLDRELLRERAVSALKDKTKAPGRLVDAAMKVSHLPDAGGGPGRSLVFAEFEPWPEAVEGGALLAELEATFERYTVLAPGAAVALALWTLFTYCFDAFPVSPLLALTSPEKRCGKTTLVTLLSNLVRRPLPASNISPAALFRAVEAYEPTLLVDEADTFLKEREELRGILNSGHTRATAFVVRTVGDQHEARTFSTWGPKALAMIGRLPSTLEDRSILVPMKRKAPGETVERLRLDRLEEFLQLRQKATRWALDRHEALVGAEPRVPTELHDRAADNWRPLLAIANDAAGHWPEKARSAAHALTLGGDDDSSIRVQLLVDINRLFASRAADQLFSESLLADLVTLESRPWGEWKRGKAMTAIGLARLLKPFGVRPRKIRIGQETRQGYRAADFADAFARYLPGSSEPHTEPEHSEQRNNDGAFRASVTRNTEDSVPARESLKSPLPAGFVPSVPGELGRDSHPAGDREVFEL